MDRGRCVRHGTVHDLLGMTNVNVALPTFAGEFRAPPTTIEWVITGCLLSLATFIPVSGWAGDRFGTKRTFLFARAWNIRADAPSLDFRHLGGGEQRRGGATCSPVSTSPSTARSRRVGHRWGSLNSDSLLSRASRCSAVRLEERCGAGPCLTRYD